MGALITLLLTAGALYNVANAAKIAERVRNQWEGKQMPFPLSWVFGDPPTAAHIRRVNMVPTVAFGLLLIVGLAT